MENEVRKPKSWAKKNITDPNNRRSWTLTKLKGKNHKLTKQMNIFIDKEDLTEVQDHRMKKLKRDIERCSNAAIYREAIETGKTTFIGAASCKNKLCFVCNWARQKNIRRKYMAWFKANQCIVEMHRHDKGKTAVKYTTEKRWTGKKYPEWELAGRHEYDLMSMTLTVPHYASTGFNGEKYYFEKISYLYNRMRKECDAWKFLVFGGEYGIETIRKTNGQHIHIHSLLLVRRERQSRNKLHLAILEYWNKVTVNNSVAREQFTAEEAGAIIRGNKMIDSAYVANLNPKGSTWIDLQNIYTYSATGEKTRSATWNSKEMMIAVLETISYHFEPYAFEKETGKFDLPLMAEIAPILHGKRLYDKFGCLYGEKSLNVTDDCDIAKEYADVVEEFVDEGTGEINCANRFYLANPLFVRHIPERDYSIELGSEAKRRAIVLDAKTTTQAVKIMAELMSNQFKKG